MGLSTIKESEENQMKENILKTSIAAAAGAFVAYFNALLVPLIVLGVVMAVDYFTGLADAFVTKSLNSRIGIIGIIKKIGYLACVGVAMVVDYLISTALVQIGIDFKFTYCFAMIVVIWLIMNELISILENLSSIGVPMPGFLVKLVKRLKNSVEEKSGEPPVDKE